MGFFRCISVLFCSNEMFMPLVLTKSGDGPLFPVFAPSSNFSELEASSCLFNSHANVINSTKESTVAARQMNRFLFFKLYRIFLRCGHTACYHEDGEATCICLQTHLEGDYVTCGLSSF